MLFNSYTFLLLFLPLTLIGFQLLRQKSQRLAMVWLVMMSLVYYGWWNPDPEQPWTPFYLILICTSCCINFFIGRFLASHTFTGKGRGILALGLTMNLGVLFFYKYIGLYERTMEALTGGHFNIPDVVLPLGLSFFTFQKIAFLVDAYRGKTKQYDFLDFLLFVTFFPQLIAGPIVHHNEIMPQIQRTVSPSRRSMDLSTGIALFAMGLFKKVVMADNLAKVANPLFLLAARGERPLTMAEAWTAAVAFGLQLYFDFSGYSDMAIGAARMFGIKLPVNFHSPYKSVSIVDFWRRWHITLSRFLRDYVYFSLGGNRKGPFLRYANLLITMLLGGLWHGAGWTFILWGGMHGLFLCVNHAWFAFRKKHSIQALPKPLAIALTCIVVFAAWVPFKAGGLELDPVKGSASAALEATRSILASMFGFHGWQSWPNLAAQEIKIEWAQRAAMCLLIVWFLPNSQEILRRYTPSLGLKGFEDLTRRGTRSLSRHDWRPVFYASGAALFLMGIRQLIPLLLKGLGMGVSLYFKIGPYFKACTLFLMLGCVAYAIGRVPWRWRPTWYWTVFITLLVAGSIYQFDKVSEFIYFQF